MTKFLNKKLVTKTCCICAVIGMFTDPVATLIIFLLLLLIFPLEIIMEDLANE